MGWNTTVLIHNDALQLIAEDLDFGKKLADAITRCGIGQASLIPVSAKNRHGSIFTNAAMVIETHHQSTNMTVVIKDDAITCSAGAPTHRARRRYPKK